MTHFLLTKANKTPHPQPTKKVIKYDPTFDDFMLELEDSIAKINMHPKEYFEFKRNLSGRFWKL